MLNCFGRRLSFAFSDQTCTSTPMLFFFADEYWDWMSLDLLLWSRGKNNNENDDEHIHSLSKQQKKIMKRQFFSLNEWLLCKSVLNRFFKFPSVDRSFMQMIRCHCTIIASLEEIIKNELTESICHLIKDVIRILKNIPYVDAFIYIYISLSLSLSMYPYVSFTIDH